MTNLISRTARAYHNHGRWIADCPWPYCTNAEKLARRAAVFDCSNCQRSAKVEWPREVDAITQILKRRPVPQTRNWYPAGHDLAVRAGIEHGQSVADLIDENNRYGVA